MHSHKLNSAPSRPSKRTHRNIRPKRHHRTLRLEPLENRRLLATLGMDIEFLLDTNGDDVPDTSTNGPVGIGQPFWVEVRVQDQRSPAVVPAPGVIALPLNISWTNDNVEFAGVLPVSGPNPDSDSVQLENPLVTGNFPLQRFVDIDLSNRRFNGLRGAALPAAGADELGQPIGRAGLEWFSRLKFRAIGSGEVCFTSELAGSMSFADAAVLEDSQPAQGCLRVSGSGSLSGFVYADVDKDAVRDVDAAGTPIELGLPKVEIELYQDGTFLQSDHTGPDGWYHFEDLAPGVYEIRQPTQPSCFIDGTETLGMILPSGESRGTAGNDRFTGIELRAGEAGIDYNFGELGLRASCVNKGMLLGSSNLRQATISDPLGVRTAVVRGTAQNDTVSVVMDTAAMRVTVNGGTPQTFPLTDGQMVSIDGLEGNDSIVLTGSSADESGHFQPGYFTVRNDVCYPEPSTGTRCDWNWGLEAVGFEDVTADAAAGQDLAVVRDSTGNDTLNAVGNQAAFGLTDRELEILAFERLRAISTRGGSDVANVIEPVDYDLELLGDWT